MTFKSWKTSQATNGTFRLAPSLRQPKQYEQDKAKNNYKHTTTLKPVESKITQQKENTCFVASRPNKPISSATNPTWLFRNLLAESNRRRINNNSNTLYNRHIHDRKVV
jgi:hypothetical protein